MPRPKGAERSFARKCLSHRPAGEARIALNTGRRPMGECPLGPGDDRSGGHRAGLAGDLPAMPKRCARPCSTFVLSLAPIARPARRNSLQWEPPVLQLRDEMPRRPHFASAAILAFRHAVRCSTRGAPHLARRRIRLSSVAAWPAARSRLARLWAKFGKRDFSSITVVFSAGRCGSR